MDPALATGTSTASVVFRDGLGERRRMSDPTGADTLERLDLRDELTSVPSFEFALRERASRLAAFRHTYFARVRSVDRLNDPAGTLALVSDSIRGVRLATLLTASERPTIDINAALHLIRQLVSAVAVLHQTARDVAHGAIGPERLIVTPNARLVIAEYVLGAALEQLHYSHDRYWEALRIALPPSLGLPRFDQRTDVTQVGVVALSLVLGRLLKDDEYPARVGDAVASAWAISARGGLEPLPPGLRAWLGRALQLDPRHSFTSALDARAELDRVLSGEEEFEEEPVALPPVPVAVSHTVNTAPEVSAKPIPEPAPAPVAPRQATPAVKEPPVVKEIPVPKETPAAAHEAPLPHYIQPTPEPQSDRRWRRIAAAAAVLVGLSAAGTFAAKRFWMTPAAASTGTFNINSSPTGAQVAVDGEARGVTPLMLTLNPGAHSLELRGAGDPRTIPITIVAGTQTSQYVELPRTAATSGQLQVRTEPAGALVSVDGVARGRSPVLVDALAPGEHSVVLESDLATVKHTVTVEAGMTASLVVPLTATEGAPISGWISVSAPVELQLYENKKLLGTSQSDRLMVSAGRHEIEMVNEPLGYRAVRTVQVPAGKVAPIAMNWPTGTVAINALPWADVWVDGEKVGETPIGNLSLPIGPHEIVFRHPDLGEQRQGVTVTLKSSARVSADLRKKP